MKNLDEYTVSLLTEKEIETLSGGQISPKSSFGGDVGYIIGWVLSAMDKGASAMQFEG